MKYALDNHIFKSVFRNCYIDLKRKYFKLKHLAYLLPLLFVVFLVSCSVQTQQRNNQNFKDSKIKNDTVKIANDSLEYELLILEPNFNSWIVTQRPRGYYSKTYLEQRNRVFVTNYNIRANNPTQYDLDLYPQQINYEFDVDYGYEVNYLLYNYFVYFQEKYRQRLR